MGGVPACGGACGISPYEHELSFLELNAGELINARTSLGFNKFVAIGVIDERAVLVCAVKEVAVEIVVLSGGLFVRVERNCKVGAVVGECVSAGSLGY